MSRATRMSPGKHKEEGADLKPAVEKPSAVSFDRETKYGLGLCVVCAKRMW